MANKFPEGSRILIQSGLLSRMLRLNSPLSLKASSVCLRAVMYTTWQSRYDDLERFAERVRASKLERR